MIDPRELRIGNLLEYEYQTVTVDVISDSGFAVSGDELYPVEENIEDVKPIPITPEWLERMGFKHTVAKGYGGQDMWAGMGFITNGLVNFRGTPKHLHLEGYFNTQVKYVHQLQNLYFALTGKELEIKP